ncbi:uncharacterized protein LOC129730287 [Wyeomyia smithii]|uniref:uncharacterized protein LOC129730287 n=1 Tax=Wyeomyia smithii TaxID=174621 RepID=UPI002467D8CC|nr:uncharacterized protein LOC129730287 [Wyeomyia smithii]XP_055545463.1 uncharacterized protein LOC129730287 [Wyeomyia smithii]XP_055545464.1 uncharacterized protein LOC129730287 [Wyeomyia smithii]XP_055545465.1 uncharacterized protein LOC129730287 [Wyeomyia smithii]XP_055545467.1 uncharacterized protein LOC129730287 [Wyeomyia smithii]XP_055545468.1 uncharacterized protein LOC129730287 [Wyeomyia smithii]XP_055545469.1 uncharacterized protein LOC129730287 [Wyeomyia smithii]
MLKPLKSLLTYLQKNANSSPIFGLTSGMGPIEEPTLDADDIMTTEQINCDDPLYDPLALDECDVDVLNVSNASSDRPNSELDSSSGQIVLVDVTSLKNSPANGNHGDDAEDINSSLENAVQNGTDAVVVSENGNDESGLSLEEELENNETKSTNLEDDSFTTASCGDTPNDSVSAQCGTATGKVTEFVDTVQLNGETDPSAVPAAVGEVQQNEEEEASDGSDSGLGSEPSRNVSNLEHPPVKSNLKRRSGEETTGATSEKRSKKGISFDGVTVYYFTRMQGFGCVPSQGGCTLGMELQHMHTKRFTLAEHAAEQRKMHRAQLQELNPRSSSSEETDSDDEPSESGSEADSESYGFLQPVTTRQRRALLKAAGVRKIDSTEKDECRLIRTSREVCGCTCRGYCDPDTCACSQAGIKCQVDRPSFPCGCTQDGCANVVGRVEFNPARVRTHFIHTIMRLNLDNKASSEEQNGMGVHSASSYGNGKDWSSGPVRLPGLYGMAGVNGTDTVDGYHHLHQQQHPYTANHSYLNGHPVSNGLPPGGESLDLHYAFRDFYGPSPQTNEQLAISNSLMTSYYTNYPTNMDQYHQPHHTGLVMDQRQVDQHSPYQSQIESTSAPSSVMIDEEVTLNTPINPNFNCDESSSQADTQSSASQPIPEADRIDQSISQRTLTSSEEVNITNHDNAIAPVPENAAKPITSSSHPPSPPDGDFIDLNTPLAPGSDRLEAINDLLESSRNTLSIVKQSIIAEEDDELGDFRDPPIAPLSSGCLVRNDKPFCIEITSHANPASEGTREKLDNVQPETAIGNKSSDEVCPIIETSENLSEIIKNSIVETVSN